MQSLYLVVCIISVCYILFRKRRCDFFSISIPATVVYYYPAFFGELYDSYAGVFYPIADEVYECLLIHIFVLLFFTVLLDCLKQGKLAAGELEVIHRESEADPYDNSAVWVLAWVGVVLMVLTFLKYGGMTGGKKTVLLANASRVTEYFKYISLFVFVYAFSFASKGKHVWSLRIIGLILIGYTFILGHRSFAVIGIISVLATALMKSNQKICLGNYLKQHRKLVLFGLFAAVFFLFVKNVLAAFLGGDYDLVVSRLTNIAYYKKSFFNSEANVILANLQTVCNNNFDYSIVDYFCVLFSLIPFFGGKICSAMDIEFFEDIFNRSFNRNLHLGIGLGSTYLGEAYATGGVVFLVVVLILTFAFIAVLQIKRRETRSRTIYTWLTIVLSYFSFYIHRNSLIFLLVAARAYLYLVLAVFLIKTVLRSCKIKL